jgi:hypothetical protein
MSQALHPDDAFNYLVDFLRKTPTNSCQPSWDAPVPYPSRAITPIVPGGEVARNRVRYQPETRARLTARNAATLVRVRFSDGQSQ